MTYILGNIKAFLKSKDFLKKLKEQSLQNKLMDECARAIAFAKAQLMQSDLSNEINLYQKAQPQESYEGR